MSEPLHPTDFNNYLRFLMRCGMFALCCAILSVPVFALYIRQLHLAGEFFSGKGLAREGTKGPIQWLSGYYDAAHYLKNDIAKVTRPRVAVIGSSRMMQFRDRMFNRVEPSGFYNMGLAALNPQQALICLDNLVQTGAEPELLILGVDWWWLQTDTRDPGDTLKAFWKRHGGQRPSLWWAKAKIAFGFYLDNLQLLQQAWKDPKFHEALRDRPRFEERSKRRLLGVRAAGGGFRNDGSFRYAREIITPTPLETRRAQGLALFEAGGYRGNLINVDDLQDLESVLALSRKHEIPTIVILNPLDAVILERFQNFPGTSGYWKEFPDTVRFLCEKYRHSFRNFSDPRDAGGNDDEFIDWFHSSDKLQARLLLRLANDPETGELLEPFLDPGKLSTDIENAASPVDLYGD